MTLNADFAAALLAPETLSPVATCAPGGGPAGARFDVYRNNVTVSLIDALAEAFPVVKALVGDAFFAAMARAFIAEHPPRAPIMTFYGAALPDWLTDFPPVAGLPYLGEVAGIEQARIRACHARDAAPIDPRILQDLPPDRLGALRLAPHPSVRMVRTRFPSMSIWARNAGDDSLRDAKPGDVLICRPQWEVQMRVAPRGVGATLDALAAGAPLSRALPDDCDPPAVFACLFEAGALMREED